MGGYKPTLLADRDSERLVFQRVKPDNIYFRSYLSDEWKKSKYAMPENIRVARNVAIILGFIEFLCCCACIVYYTRRKSKVILAFVVLCFIFSLFGMWAKIRLSSWGLLTHAFFTIGVVGGLYIYEIIDICFGTDKNVHSSGMDETTVIILTSLPLLIIFGLGIYSLVLFFMVDEELEAREEADGLRPRNAGDDNPQDDDDG